MHFYTQIIIAEDRGVSSYVRKIMVLSEKDEMKMFIALGETATSIFRIIQAAVNCLVYSVLHRHCPQAQCRLFIGPFHNPVVLKFLLG